VVKVLHLLAVDEVLHERRAPWPGLETALVLDRAADVRGHVRALAVTDLVLAQEVVSLALPVGSSILPLAESFGVGVGTRRRGEAEQTAQRHEGLEGVHRHGDEQVNKRMVTNCPVPSGKRVAGGVGLQSSIWITKTDNAEQRKGGKVSCDWELVL
jgi:hypothetical protein